MEVVSGCLAKNPKIFSPRNSSNKNQRAMLSLQSNAISLRKLTGPSIQRLWPGNIWQRFPGYVATRTLHNPSPSFCFKECRLESILV